MDLINQNQPTQVGEIYPNLQNAENLPYSDNSIDTVILDNILYQLPYYERAINEAYRVARKKIILRMHYGLAHEDVIRKNAAGEWENKYSKDKVLGLLRSLAAKDKDNPQPEKRDDYLIFFTHDRNHECVIEIDIKKENGIIKEDKLSPETQLPQIETAKIEIDYNILSYQELYVLAKKVGFKGKFEAKEVLIDYLKNNK